MKVILIHGNGGSTADDIWLPWLERELTRLSLEVINRTFPDNVKARAAVWLPFIEELGADANTILVGHSSGAVAAMRYAETHQLAGSVLVGVCHTDLGDSGEAASGYYREPWQWQRIRFVAAQLRCSYFEFTDRGHFMDYELPEVMQFVRRQLSL